MLCIQLCSFGAVCAGDAWASDDAHVVSMNEVLHHMMQVCVVSDIKRTNHSHPIHVAQLLCLHR